ncbi:MAG: rRNA adenine N-6-methyltransferase family protein, partial [Atribacterota bacterium]|nr:rRNA adenine N-6-methyltransferase family protein [Atribacterota bacterium]
MNPIYQFPDSPKRLASLMSEYQFYPKKKLGQNFLIDSNITKIIVKALSLKDNDIIFEIGTGMGILTKELMSS